MYSPTVTTLNNRPGKHVIHNKIIIAKMTYNNTDEPYNWNAKEKADTTCMRMGEMNLCTNKAEE